jgi:hypothetical protein
MLDSGRLDSHFDRVTAPNLANPLIAFEHGQRMCNCSVQCLRRHFEVMFVTVRVAERNRGCASRRSGVSGSDGEEYAT